MRIPRATHPVLVFAREDDALRVLRVLPKRFAKYGLQLHPKKTRLVRFTRPPRGGGSGGPRRESFDFLGFTHYWGRSRKGNPVVKQKTARSRLARSLQRVSAWCRANRHWPVAEQAQMLGQKLRGYYGYYGVTGNYPALNAFADQVRAIWRKWLDRRSWTARMDWGKFYRLLGRYPLPPPRIVHCYVANS